MLRIGKLTDYATSVMAVLAELPDAVHSASDLAARTRLETTTVSKLLKQLAHSGLVESRRGASGGYRLARPASEISIADIVSAMEGPIGVTECSLHTGLCGHEAHCGTRGNWRRISEVVEQALRGIRLSEMAQQPPRAIPVHLQPQ
jgi:FeS assembly SUF system regulator